MYDVVTPHLNRLDETVQMKGHNIRFYAEVAKIILSYHKYSRSFIALRIHFHVKYAYIETVNNVSFCKMYHTKMKI